MANPHRSSQGLSARPVSNSDEIQLRIDPIHADLDEEISVLHKQVTQLKNQMLMSRAEAGVKNGMTKLNRAVAEQRSNHILQVIIFGLACFSILYLWSKHLKR